MRPRKSGFRAGDLNPVQHCLSRPLVFFLAWRDPSPRLSMGQHRKGSKAQGAVSRSPGETACLRAPA